MANYQNNIVITVYGRTSNQWRVWSSPTVGKVKKVDP